jgi:hypothetical protein
VKPRIGFTNGEPELLLVSTGVCHDVGANAGFYIED